MERVDKFQLTHSQREKIFFVLSYRHPNKYRDEMNVYMESLQNIYEKMKNEKPAASIISGDYNSRSSLFRENDIENWKGRIFSNLLSNNLEELINEPTHIRDDGTQTCIGLICTDQPYLFTDTGVLPTLDPHSNHNIIHYTLNVNFPLLPTN